jgi:hypothetical protein
MSIIKRLLEKHGKDESKVKGDDRLILDMLKSFVPGPSDGTETPDNMPDGDDQYRDDPIPTTTRKRRKKDG